MTQYSPISDSTQPPSPVPQPVVVIHFDTDDSDTQEIIVSIITNVRAVTVITRPSSPIIFLDTETIQSVTSGPPPMKIFRITLEPSPLLKKELNHDHVHPPSAPIPPGTPLDQPTTSTWTTLDQPSTLTDDLQTTMAQIESVWEAQMNAHIIEKLAEHDSAIGKKFADQDKQIE